MSALGEVELLPTIVSETAVWPAQTLLTRIPDVGTLASPVIPRAGPAVAGRRGVVGAAGALWGPSTSGSGAHSGFDGERAGSSLRPGGGRRRCVSLGLLIRTTPVLLLAAALVGAGCSSSDDNQTGAPTSQVTTTISVGECEDSADEAILPLEAFIDEYEDLSPEEWNELDPPPSVEAAQEEMVAIAQAAVDRGCAPTWMEELLQERIAALDGDSEVGRAIAAALRGDGPILGPPAPIIQTTLPRETEPSTVVFERGDDLRAILDRVAPGSTIEFGVGTFQFVEPIVVGVDVTFQGAGRDQTLISSSADGLAVAFVGPGGFTVRDLVIEHTGPKEASVLLAIEGPLRVIGAELRGGRTGAETAGGGHGLVLAFDPIEGFPERTSAERAGEILISDSLITSNDAAGVLMTGDAVPTIEDSTITDNGGCGVCFTSTSSGTVRDTLISGNQIGVQVSDTATPVLETVEVADSRSVGISVDGESRVSVDESWVHDSAEVGVQASGASDVTVARTTIANQQVGVLAAGTATVRVADNSFESHGIGVQVGEEATVDTTGNRISASTSVAINYGDDSSGRIVENEVTDAPELGIQVAGRSRPVIEGNTVSTPGAAGISVLDEASPMVTGNEISDRQVAIQAGGSGTPEIRANTLPAGGSLGINVMEFSRATVVANQLNAYDIGIQVGGGSAPTITDNVITASTTVGILFGNAAGGRATGNSVTASEAAGIVVGGQAVPTLDGNELVGNAVGLVYREDGAGTARSNTVREHAIGVQIADAAAPFLFQNEITVSAEAGISITGTSAARLEQNTLTENGNISIQIAESAQPDIAGNQLRGRGVYGIVLRDGAGGRVRDNVISDHVYGMELAGSASPTITGNAFDTIGVTSITYRGSSGGTASNNECSEDSLTSGIVITDDADPQLGDNFCTVGAGGITQSG